MPSQKYLKINGVTTDYSDATPVNLSWNTASPAQADFVINILYSATAPTTGQSIEWYRRDNTLIWSGVIAEIDIQGMDEGNQRIALSVKAVGKDDRLFRRTTWNRATFRCAQYRSFSGTATAADVTGAGHLYWDSGDKFSQDLVGKTLTYNGGSKIVASVQSPDELTLTSTTGTVGAVAYTYTVYCGDVVKDLIDTYCDFEGFTYTGTSIQNGVALDSKGVLFDSPIFVNDAIQQLLTANPSFYFAVDVNQVVYFAVRTLVAAPADFTPTSGQQKRGVVGTITAVDVRNCEISTTTWDAVVPTPDSFTGDGVARSWFTTKPIAKVTSVFLNGVTVEIADGSTTATAPFYFWPNDHMIWQDPLDPVLGTGDTLEVNYQALADNLIEYSDDVSRAARAVIEGSGFGRYEQPIDRTNLPGKTTALADATASVNRLKENYYSVDINTFELDYAIGQTISDVTIPRVQLSSLALFIDSIKASDTTTKGSAYDFEYTLTCISVSRRITDDGILRDTFSVSSGGGSGGGGVSTSGGGGGSTGGTASVATLELDGKTSIGRKSSVVVLRNSNVPNSVVAWVDPDGGAPIGHDLTFDITVAGVVWLSMTLVDSTYSITAPSADVTAAGVLVSGAPIRAVVTSVGTTYPGLNLSIFIYLS